MPEDKKRQERAGVILPDAGVLTREFSLEPDGIAYEGTTLKSMVIATDQAVMRTFGEETLVISEDAINLSRFTENGIPLLKAHDARDRDYGWVKNPQIVDGKLLADLEFDPRYDEAMEIFNAIAIDKKPKCFSIGYLSDQFETTRMGATLAESRVVNKWTLFDVSVVGYGEDEGAGAYRNASAPEALKSNEEDKTANDGIMKTESLETRETIEKDSNLLGAMPEETTDKKMSQAEVTAAATAAAKSERASIAAVMALCKAHNEDPEPFISNNVPLDGVKDALLKKMETRAASAPKPMFADNIDKSPEAKYREGKYKLNIRSAMAAAAAKFAGVALQGEAGYVNEISQSVAKDNTANQNAVNGIQYPFDALQTRAFQSTTGGQGAAGRDGANTGQAMVSTLVQEDRLKMYLFENTVTGKLVTDIVTNQVGNPAIPVITDVGDASFPGEGNAATPQALKSKNIPVIAKPIICAYPITNLAQAQIPSMNGRIEQILMRQLNRAVDRTTLVGGGNGEAVGICATPDVSTAKSGAVGDATRNMDLDEVNELIRDLRVEKIIGDLDIVVPPALLYYWRGLKNANGTKRWEVNTFAPNQGPLPLYLDEAKVNMSTNLKGAGDAAADQRFLIGNFADNVTQVFFGNSFSLSVGLNSDDLMKDQVTFKMATYYDVAVGRPEAFKAYSAIRPGAGD